MPIGSFSGSYSWGSHSKTRGFASSTSSFSYVKPPAPPTAEQKYNKVYRTIKEGSRHYGTIDFTEFPNIDYSNLLKLLASYKYPISMKISIKVMNVHDVFELLNNPSCHISELILGDSDVNQTGLIEKLGQYIKSTACKLDSLDCLGLGYVSSKGNKILLKALENNKTINKLHLKNAPSSALVSLLEVNISLREISGSVLPEAVKIALARNRKIKESGVLKSLSKLAVDKRNKNDGMANVVRAIDALWRETGFNIYSVLNCNYPFLADAFFETDNMLGLWFILISDDGDKDPYIIWNFLRKLSESSIKYFHESNQKEEAIFKFLLAFKGYHLLLDDPEKWRINEIENIPIKTFFEAFFAEGAKKLHLIDHDMNSLGIQLTVEEHIKLRDLLRSLGHVPNDPAADSNNNNNDSAGAPIVVNANNEAIKKDKTFISQINDMIGSCSTIFQNALLLLEVYSILTDDKMTLSSGFLQRILPLFGNETSQLDALESLYRWLEEEVANKKVFQPKKDISDFLGHFAFCSAKKIAFPIENKISLLQSFFERIACKEGKSSDLESHVRESRLLDFIPSDKKGFFNAVSESRKRVNNALEIEQSSSFSSWLCC